MRTCNTCCSYVSVINIFYFCDLGYDFKTFYYPSLLHTRCLFCVLSHFDGLINVTAVYIYEVTHCIFLIFPKRDLLKTYNYKIK